MNNENVNRSENRFKESPSPLPERKNPHMPWELNPNGDIPIIPEDPDDFPEDIYLRVYNRLASGNWVVLTGQLNSISVIERLAYPPGTYANADFESVLGFRKYFFLAKKTWRLRSLLNLANDTWASLFAVRVTNHEGNVLAFDTRHFKQLEERETLLESYVNAITEEIER